MRTTRAASRCLVGGRDQRARWKRSRGQRDRNHGGSTNRQSGAKLAAGTSQGRQNGHRVHVRGSVPRRGAGRNQGKAPTLHNRDYRRHSCAPRGAQRRHRGEHPDERSHDAWPRRMSDMLTVVSRMRWASAWSHGHQYASDGEGGGSPFLILDSRKAGAVALRLFLFQYRVSVRNQLSPRKARRMVRRARMGSSQGSVERGPKMIEYLIGARLGS